MIARFNPFVKKNIELFSDWNSPLCAINYAKIQELFVAVVILLFVTAKAKQPPPPPQKKYSSPYETNVMINEHSPSMDL